MATVHTSVESARGCGFRKPGGKYLVAGQPSEPCEKLPIELHVCEVCGGGIKQTRAFTWIKVDPLLDPGAHGDTHHDVVCPLGARYTEEMWSKGEKAGLIWIGAAFYKTPGDFMREAAEMGISRRVKSLPRGFKVGETWVALAHPKAIRGECEHGAPAEFPCSNCPDGKSEGEWRGGVITFFRPTAIEYIVTGKESEEELDRFEEQGLRLVRVVKAGENVPLDEAA
jgi:hypothetical protein